MFPQENRQKTGALHLACDEAHPGIVERVVLRLPLLRQGLRLDERQDLPFLGEAERAPSGFTSSGRRSTSPGSFSRVSC